jgi:hypothetical protein
MLASVVNNESGRDLQYDGPQRAVFLNVCETAAQ